MPSKDKPTLTLVKVEEVPVDKRMRKFYEQLILAGNQIVEAYQMLDPKYQQHVTDAVMDLQMAINNVHSKVLEAAFQEHELRWVQ